MVAPAAGLKTDDQLYRYYEAVFRTIGEDVPVVYQDYPQATGVYLPPAVFERLVDDFKQLVMLKHEDAPGLNIAEPGNSPTEGASYPGATALADHILDSLADENFDLAQSDQTPSGAPRDTAMRWFARQRSSSPPQPSMR